MATQAHDAAFELEREVHDGGWWDAPAAGELYHGEGELRSVGGPPGGGASAENILGGTSSGRNHNPNSV